MSKGINPFVTNDLETFFRNAKLKKQEEKRMAKEEIKFVKKKGEKGLKQIFNEDEGMREQNGVRKNAMKRGGQVKS